MALVCKQAGELSGLELASRSNMDCVTQLSLTIRLHDFTLFDVKEPPCRFHAVVVESPGLQDRVCSTQHAHSGPHSNFSRASARCGSTIATQNYLSTPIRGQCARLPRPASHKPRLLLPHYKGAFLREEGELPVVGPRPAVPRPRSVCPCWQTRRNFLGRRTR